MVLLLTMIGVVLFFAALVAMGLRTLVHKLRAPRELRELAELLKGTAFPRQLSGFDMDGVTIEGSYAGAPLVVGYSVVEGGRIFPRITVPVQHPVAPFRVDRAGAARWLSRRLGIRQSDEVGRDSLDEKYRFKGPSGTIQHFALQPGLEEALDTVFAVLRPFEVALDEDTFEVNFVAPCTGAKRIAAALDSVVAIAKLCSRKPIEVKALGRNFRFAWTGGTDQALCPYCRDDLELEGPLALTACLRCGTAHHDACMVEAGGCTVFGCGGDPDQRAHA